MSLSTTFTQCAPETTEFGKITQIKAISPFKVIQGHRFWYQSKVHIRILISRRWLGKYCALSLEFTNLLQNFHLAVIEYL